MRVPTTTRPGPTSTELESLDRETQSHPIWTEPRGPVKSIQSTVNQAARPLDVVGSAARGERRGLGTDLPIGKGPGTRSDIDYVVPHGSVPFYESTGLYKDLPDIDRIIAGIPNPFIGPSIRFEPFTDPYFIPGIG